MATRPILTLILWSAVSTAAASPRSDSTVGRAVFTGATVPSATSISLNPAAIGLGSRDEIYLSVTAVLEQFGIDRKTIDLATDSLVPGDQVRDLELGPGGSLAFVWHPYERATLGFEIRSPSPEMFPNDPALRYHSLGSRQRNYLSTIAASFKVTSRIYFGFSLTDDITSLRLRYARDTGLDPGRADCGGTPCGLENPAASEVYDVTVRSPNVLSKDNLRGNLGFVARVWRDVWLGIAYHNTPGFGIQTELAGEMNVTKAPRDGGEHIRGDSTVYVSYPASVDGEVRAHILPDLEVHVGGRWEDLSRMQAYDVRGYGSSFRGQNVPEWQLRARGMHDAFAIWAGLEQLDIGERADRLWWLRFGGRLGLETSSQVPNKTSPSTNSPTSFTLDLGAQVRPGRDSSWIIQLSYGLQAFARVQVDDSAYDPRLALDCIDSGFNYESRSCEALRNGYAISTAAGDYSRFQHAIRLGLRYALP
ncbi:MAG: hypothetical protein H6Q90_1089 [Deltaproteobacteria bacterium]|nr:hypothetical protein [Deltaproteobacteria bacterium]